MEKRGACILGLVLTALLWAFTAVWADIQQAEENPSAQPWSEIVMTNGIEDLGGLFVQGNNYPIGLYAWQPVMYFPTTIVWADTSNLPAGLAGITNFVPTSVEGVNAFPLWVTLYPESNVVTVLQPWSDDVLTEFSLPDGFPSWEIYEANLRPSCILSGINYTNWQTLVEEGHDQFAVPQVVTHAWLMDIGDRDAYWANLEADCEAQAALSSSAGGFTLLLDDEEGIESLDPCSLTNLLQVFAVSSVVYTSNGISLTFPSCQVFRYKILTAETLNSNTAWATDAYTSYMWGQPGVSATSWTDTTATNVDHRFYKVGRINGSIVAAGAYHSLAVLPDGSLWAWGQNSSGQLGDYTNSSRSVPELVGPSLCDEQSISNVQSVAGGYDYSVAADATGLVWTWGGNYIGQLGNGETQEYGTRPWPIKGIRNIVSVVAGDSHTLALRADGKVFAWGYGGHGQLGVGPLATVQTNLPIQVTNLTQVVAVAAGAVHSAALNESGNVWTWGDDENGQLGDGGGGSIYWPMQLPGISNVIAIAAGGYHTIALMANKTVWTWGDNSYGELGRGSNSAIPLPVSGLSNVVSIAGGYFFSLAVTSNGQVYAWGDNSFGQLGTNGPSELDTPTKVAGISNAVLVSAHSEGSHSLAITVDQGVYHYWAWGDNTYGQIGNGTSGGVQYSPTQLVFNTSASCACYQLGTNGSFTAQSTGTLVLYVNDGFSGDNDPSSSFLVTVTGPGGSLGTTNVPGNAGGTNTYGVAGIPIGTVSNRVTYSYTASGFINWAQNPDDFSDANGNDTNGVPWDCITISGSAVTNEACPTAQCVSLVGKIE